MAYPDDEGVPRNTMMRRSPFLATAVLAAVLGAPCRTLGQPVAPAARVAPHVVETTPTLGAHDVDPALKELMVRFDRPMSTRSWSWCGGGASYPEVTARPRFIDPFTAVLPVKLEPGKTYYLMINCPSGHNFVSTEGVPAESVPYRFTTATSGTLQTADRRNLKAWQELRKLLRERYSHYERTGTDWEAAFADNTEWVVSAPDEKEWLARAGTVLEAADDPHLYFRNSKGERQSTHKRRGFLNANPDAIRRTFPNLKDYNALVRAGSLGDIGYLAINGWESPKGECDAIRPALESLKSTKVLILDVRANGGGGEDLARVAAGFFLEHGGVYARDRWRDPGAPNGWGPMLERRVGAGPEATRYKGRILVLQGSVCLSSNEAFLEMLHLSPRATFMGQASGGSSGNPMSFPLPNGAEIVIPRWQSFRLDGTPLEGKGIPPDIEVKGEFRDTDPVLMAALEWCRKALAGGS